MQNSNKYSNLTTNTNYSTNTNSNTDINTNTNKSYFTNYSKYSNHLINSNEYESYKPKYILKTYIAHDGNEVNEYVQTWTNK